MKINDFIRTKEAENARENDTFILNLCEKFINENLSDNELEIWKTCTEKNKDYTFQVWEIGESLFAVSGEEHLFYTEFVGNYEIKKVYKYLINRMMPFFNYINIMKRIIENYSIDSYEEEKKTGGYAFNFSLKEKNIKIQFFEKNMIFISDGDSGEYVTIEEMEEKINEFIKQ